MGTWCLSEVRAAWTRRQSRGTPTSRGSCVSLTGDEFLSHNPSPATYRLSPDLCAPALGVRPTDLREGRPNLPRLTSNLTSIHLDQQRDSPSGYNQAGEGAWPPAGVEPADTWLPHTDPRAPGHRLGACSARGTSAAPAALSGAGSAVAEQRAESEGPCGGQAPRTAQWAEGRQGASFPLQRPLVREEDKGHAR